MGAQTGRLESGQLTVSVCFSVTLIGLLDRYLRSPVCKQAERNNENDNMQLLKMVKRDLPADL